MSSAPGNAVVVGAGIVGLSCAWGLQRHGVQVEVLDRYHEGAGSSWGNAGYVAPSLTVPLPEPAMLRYALRAMFDAGSPVAVPLLPGRDLSRFLMAMARNCTTRRWQQGMAVYRDLNQRAFAAFDDQHADGVTATAGEADILAAFRRPADAGALLHELQGVTAAGLPMRAEVLDGDAARRYEAHLSPEVGFAVRIRGQRYVTPAEYVVALADHVRGAGGKITDRTEVEAVERHGTGLKVHCAGRTLEADAVVLASGALLSDLARPHGVRLPVHAGRGYSFTVDCDEPLQGPLYLPSARVAITPTAAGARVTGIMEFAGADDPPVAARFATIERGARPMLRGIDWASRANDWVGSRPLTADGIPLVGASRTKDLYVAGGHGMWGVTLGPLTGQLLAEQIVTGVMPPELRALDPTR